MNIWYILSIAVAVLAIALLITGFYLRQSWGVSKLKKELKGITFRESVSSLRTQSTFNSADLYALAGAEGISNEPKRNRASQMSAPLVSETADTLSATTPPSGVISPIPAPAFVPIPESPKTPIRAEIRDLPVFSPVQEPVTVPPPIQEPISIPSSIQEPVSIPSSIQESVSIPSPAPLSLDSETDLAALEEAETGYLEIPSLDTDLTELEEAETGYLEVSATEGDRAELEEAVTGYIEAVKPIRPEVLENPYLEVSLVSSGSSF